MRRLQRIGDPGSNPGLAQCGEVAQLVELPTIYRGMKPIERLSGRGFDSRQVHHMRLYRFSLQSSESGVEDAVDGPAQVSTGEQLEMSRPRKRESTLVKQGSTSLSANDDSFAVARVA